MRGPVADRPPDPDLIDPDRLMEAASVPAPKASPVDTIRRFIGNFGLIAVLLILPVVFAIDDLRDEGDLSRLANNIVDGLSNGAIWALVAIGYTLVYGIIELINFAHGEVFMIGSFVTRLVLRRARPDRRHRRRRPRSSASRRR